MTSSDSTLSPELRELLGDIGKQRESALFSLSRKDVQKLVDRPEREGIDRTAGRFTLAEREILDGYRHEVARLIADRTRLALTTGELPDTRAYCSSQAKSDRRMIEGSHAISSRAELLSQHSPAELLVPLTALQQSPIPSIVGLQAHAVRLSPTAVNRYLLADVIRLAGDAGRAVTILRQIMAEPSSGVIASFAAELVGSMAGDDAKLRTASNLYAASSEIGRRRLGPRVQWVIQSALIADIEQLRRARRSLADCESRDEGLVDQILYWRLESRDRDEWRVTDAMKSTVDHVMQAPSAFEERVLSVFA